MVSVTTVAGVDPRTQSMAQDIVQTYKEQGAAHAARMLREKMESQALTDAQKKDLYKQLSSNEAPSSDARKQSMVGDLANQLGDKAQADLSKGGDPNGGAIDTKAEYDSVTKDMSATYQSLSRENPADGVQDDMGKFATDEARTFSTDVIDGIGPTAQPGGAPEAQLGHYGSSLLAAFQEQGVYVEQDASGAIKGASPVLGEATAFSIGGTGKTGLFTLSSQERAKIAAGFTGDVKGTKQGNLPVMIEDDDTWLKIFGREDVQDFYLNADEKAKLAGESSDKKAYYLLDKYGKTQDWDMRKLGDTNGDGNYVEGYNDPDLARTGSVHTLINDAGQTLTLNEANTKHQTDPVKAGAKTVVDSKDPEKAWDDVTAGMSDQMKQELAVELLNSDRDIGEGLYRKMGFNDKAADALGNHGGRHDDTGMNDGRAIYKAYTAMGGDPAGFRQWMNDNASGDDADHRMRLLGIHAQGLMDDSDDGKNIQRGTNDDGNFFDTRNSTVGLADLDTVTEYVAALKSADFKAPKIAAGKEDVWSAEGS